MTAVQTRHYRQCLQFLVFYAIYWALYEQEKVFLEIIRDKVHIYTAVRNNSTIIVKVNTDTSTGS